jgi:hypothetical protein
MHDVYWSVRPPSPAQCPFASSVDLWLIQVLHVMYGVLMYGVVMHVMYGVVMYGVVLHVMYGLDMPAQCFFETESAPK